MSVATDEQINEVIDLLKKSSQDFFDKLTAKIDEFSISDKSKIILTIAALISSIGASSGLALEFMTSSHPLFSVLTQFHRDLTAGQAANRHDH